MKTIMYEDICKKIGFALEEFPEKDFGDDYMPFGMLSMEELDFVMEYCREHGIKGKKWPTRKR